MVLAVIHVHVHKGVVCPFNQDTSSFPTRVPNRERFHCRLSFNQDTSSFPTGVLYKEVPLYIVCRLLILY